MIPTVLPEVISSLSSNICCLTLDKSVSSLEFFSSILSEVRRGTKGTSVLVPMTDVSSHYQLYLSPVGSGGLNELASIPGTSSGADSYLGISPQVPFGCEGLSYVTIRGLKSLIYSSFTDDLTEIYPMIVGNCRCTLQFSLGSLLPFIRAILGPRETPFLSQPILSSDSPSLTLSHRVYLFTLCV